MLDSPGRTNERPIVRPAYPTWARRSSHKSGPHSLEDAAFCSGAALGAVHGTASSDLHLAPVMLWRRRLALDASVALGCFHGRSEDPAVIRDNWYLRDGSNDPGPAGHILGLWRQLGTTKALRPAECLEEILSVLSVRGSADLIEAIKQARGDAGSAVHAAAMVAARVMAIRPGDFALALWLADAVLAQKLKWAAPVPLLPAHIKRSWILNAGDLLTGNETWLLQCHRAYAEAAMQAFQTVCDLQRRTVEFEAIIPKLRTKGSERAIRLFLTEDALAPGSSQTGLNARSARRLCERLGVQSRHLVDRI